MSLAPRRLSRVCLFAKSILSTSRDAARQKEQLEAVVKVHLTDKEIEAISEAGKGLFYRHFQQEVWEHAKQ